MTTIAANQQGMAADSQVDAGGVRGSMTKLFRVRGDILGIAGTVSVGLAFVEWYRKNDADADPPEFDDDSSVLVLRKDGTLQLWEGPFPSECDPYKTYYAIGTGAMAALAVLMSGGGPRKAVRVACRLDVSSGGEVQYLRRRAKS